MSDKPEALRLADELDAMFGATEIDERVTAELRRLHEVNKELVDACKAALSDDQPYIEKCRAAIAKATGEQA